MTSTRLLAEQSIKIFVTSLLHQVWFVTSIYYVTNNKKFYPKCKIFFGLLFFLSFWFSLKSPFLPQAPSPSRCCGSRTTRWWSPLPGFESSTKRRTGTPATTTGCSSKRSPRRTRVSTSARRPTSTGRPTVAVAWRWSVSKPSTSLLTFSLVAWG